jgi:bifunctional non-homologous end joining protein LigD
VAEALAKLPVKNGWLDGEIAMLDANGVSSFPALQDALSRGASALSDAPRATAGLRAE